jgi:hypothetical protein
MKEKDSSHHYGSLCCSATIRSLQVQILNLLRIPYCVAATRWVVGPLLRRSFILIAELYSQRYQAEFIIWEIVELNFELIYPETPIYEAEFDYLCKEGS